MGAGDNSTSNAGGNGMAAVNSADNSTAIGAGSGNGLASSNN